MFPLTVYCQRSKLLLTNLNCSAPFCIYMKNTEKETTRSKLIKEALKQGKRQYLIK